MTKESIWAAMGPSGSLSDDAACWSLPSSRPPEGSSVGDLQTPGRRDSAALGTAALCSLAAFVEDLRDKEEVRGPSAAPTPGAGPVHIPFGLWLRALLGDQDSGLGVHRHPLCFLLTGRSHVFPGAQGQSGPAGRLIFNVHVILETCHQRVPTWGLPIAAKGGRAGWPEVSRAVQRAQLPTLSSRPLAPTGTGGPLCAWRGH